MADEPYDPSKHGPIVLQTPNVDQPAAAPEPYDPSKHGAIEAAPKSTPLSGVPGSMLENAIPDAMEVAKNTVGGVKQIAEYVAKNPGEVLSNLPAYPVKMGEELLSHYVDTYGSWEKAKSFAAEHPVQFAMDVAPVLGQLFGAVGKAGRAVGAGPALDKAAEVAGKFSPVNILGGASNAATGVGEGVAQEAFRTGKLGDQVAKDFREGLRNPAAGMDTALSNAKQGIATMKKAMFDKFAELEPLWKSDKTNLPFAAVDKAEQDMLKEIQVNGTNKFKVSDTDRAKIQNLQDVVDQWRQDPSLHNAEGLDALKQRLRNEINYASDSKPVKRAATTLSQSAKQAILDSIPDAAPYKKAMKGYFDSADHLGDIEEALALGDKAKATTSISRLQSVMRNNANTLYGTRKAFTEALEREGNVSLMPSLAGSAMSSSMPRGIGRGVIAGSVPEAALHAFTSHGDPLTAALAFGTGVASTSPRLAGELFHGAGRASRILGPTAGQATLGVPGAALRSVTDPNNAPPARRRGGYFGGV